jgi:hypothetical protein
MPTGAAAASATDFAANRVGKRQSTKTRDGSPTGTPGDIVKVKRSYTAEFLKPVLLKQEPKAKKRIQAAE